MTDFSQIPNEELRSLAKTSSTFASFDEEQKNILIQKFNKAEEKDINSYIAVFQKEKAKLDLIDEKEKKILEAEAVEMEKAAADLDIAQVRHEKAALKENEAKSVREDDQQEMDLLQQLNDI